MQFTYSTSRADVAPTWQAGSSQKTTALLTDIKTYTGTTLVIDYKLAYRAGTSTLHSRLTSFTQCDAAGTTCLAPTTFDWQGGTGLPTMNTNSLTLAHGFTLLSGDFNNDGLTDALKLDNSCPSGGVIFSGANAIPNVGSSLPPA